MRGRCLVRCWRAGSRSWSGYARRRSTWTSIARALAVRMTDITTILDTSDVRELRDRASELHRSQTAPFDSMPDDLRLAFLTTDHLIRMQPPWTGGPVERELGARGHSRRWPSTHSRRLTGPTRAAGATAREGCRLSLDPGRRPQFAAACRYAAGRTPAGGRVSDDQGPPARTPANRCPVYATRACHVHTAPVCGWEGRWRQASELIVPEVDAALDGVSGRSRRARRR